MRRKVFSDIIMNHNVFDGADYEQIIDAMAALWIGFGEDFITFEIYKDGIKEKLKQIYAEQEEHRKEMNKVLVKVGAICEKCGQETPCIHLPPVWDNS